MTNSAHPDLNLSTQCDCGAITLAVKGSVMSMFLCACQNCQKITGSGHSSVVLLAADALKVVGATKSTSRPAASGANFTRHFCPECGTTIHAQSSRAPGLRIVPAGIFAGQNSWFEPNQLLFARSHPAWDVVADHLPRHETYKQQDPR